MVVLTYTLAFVIEIAMLYAFGRAGYFALTGAVLPWLGALLAVTIAIGLWAAPKSTSRLRGAALLGFKTAMFAAALAAFAFTGMPVAAAQFGVLAAAYLMLATRLSIL